MGDEMLTRSFVAALCFAALASTLRAQVIVSNLAEPARAVNVLNGTDWAAQSFETDARRYFLTSIDVITGEDTGDAAAFAELRSADVNGDLDGEPGALQATFTVPDLFGPLAVRTFVPDRVVVLQRNHRYYFVFGGIGDGPINWSYAEGNGQTGPGALSQYQYTYDGAATWINFGTDNPFHIAVKGDEIPCPSDFNADGFLTFEDFDAFVNAFEIGEFSADFNLDDFLTFEDFDDYVTAFEAGCE
jgi:hypothetical protein